MATWFSDKLVSEIIEADLQELVDQQAAEDQWLDFKSEPHGHTREMLKDVCALANADGGYMVIGVAEGAGNVAIGFQAVAQATSTAENMLKSCTQNITPRIEGLEIMPRLAPSGREVIVVRVPPSARKPHMCRLKNQTQFWRRYGTENREMTHEEIRAAFLEDRILRGILELNAGLDALLRQQTHERLHLIQPSDNALGASSPEELRRLMDLRFEQAVADAPFFRLSALPLRLSPANVDVGDPEVRRVFEDPPLTDESGWAVYGDKASVTVEGIETPPGVRDQRLVVLRNGFIEFSQPARSELFQWRQSESEAEKHPWLYPYAVCELPVNFVRLAKAIYEAAHLQGEAGFFIEFRNIKGFTLRPYGPESIGFLRSGPGTLRPYPDKDFKGREVRVAIPFEADPVAFQLVEQLYNAFGLERQHIPCFDPQRRFTLRD